jgi:DNA polymerase-3 subunit epsilon
VGVVWFEHGREVDSFKSLIRPIHPEWGSWQYLNLPYRLEDALNAPCFEQVWSKLKPRLSGQILIAHNAPSAEAIYLGGALAHHKLRPPEDSELLCSLALAKRVWPDETAHGLRRMASKFDFPLDHHDPESDARTCGQLVLAAARATGSRSLNALREATRWRSVPYQLIPPVLPEAPARMEEASVYGIELTRWESPRPLGLIQRGDRFVMSGLSEAEKHRIRAEARAKGVRPVSTLNARTAFVVAGELMGPAKYARCRLHGIPIITPEKWEQLKP